MDKAVHDLFVGPFYTPFTALHREWALRLRQNCDAMGVTVELQNLGDAELCRDISARIEHAFSDRQGEWRVSITGSRATENWEMRVEGPNGFERSYSLASSSGEHEPEAIGELVLKLVSPATQP